MYIELLIVKNLPKKSTNGNVSDDYVSATEWWHHRNS
jgi:hypothetical protein